MHHIEIKNTKASRQKSRSTSPELIAIQDRKPASAQPPPDEYSTTPASVNTSKRALSPIKYILQSDKSDSIEVFL
jgi:hypothetical protein